MVKIGLHAGVFDESERIHTQQLPTKHSDFLVFRHVTLRRMHAVGFDVSEHVVYPRRTVVGEILTHVKSGQNAKKKYLFLLSSCSRLKVG